MLSFTNFFSDMKAKFENEYDLYFKSLLKLYFRHNFTWDGFLDIISVINSHPDVKYKYPETQYSILQKIDPRYSYTEYGECEKCNLVAEITAETVKCPQCDGKLSRENEIMFVSLKQQLQHELKKNSDYLCESKRSEGVIADIYDGLMYVGKEEDEVFFNPKYRWC